VRRSLAFAASAALALASCDRPNYSTPVDAYLSFVRATQSGNGKVAFTSLSQGSQALLTERAKAASSAAGGNLREDPVSWLLTRSGRVEEAEKVELVGQQGDEATIRVTSEKGARELKLRKESGGWKLDVTPLLEGQTKS
jgi:hypothetical protein